MFGPFSFVTFFPKYVESRDAPTQVTVVLECPITNVCVVLRSVRYLILFLPVVLLLSVLVLMRLLYPSPIVSGVP